MNTKQYVTDLINSAPELKGEVELISWSTFPNGHSNTYGHGKFKSKAEILSALDDNLISHIWGKRNFYKKYGFR